MKTFSYPKQSDWPSLCQRPSFDLKEIEQKVAPIMDAVSNRGDVALLELTEKFDGVNLDDIELDLSSKDFSIDSSLQEAIKVAKSNIEKFHQSQKIESKRVETTPGVFCWQEMVPIEKVGLYIPGGSAPLFSTLLMLAIPAQIAGCQEIVVCTPPDENGEINEVIGWTCKFLGIEKVLLIGGAQAIASMTYGTETVTKVDKIFGPGNQYVTAAKQLAQKEGIAIDMPAGPSEVLVIADETANPEFIAADLLSQAEHGPDSQVVLVTTSEDLVSKVNQELINQLDQLPRKQIATQAIDNSQSVLLKDLDEAITFSNQYAPEHLIISTDKSHELAKKVVNAGSVFLGNWSCESAGDYASGTNHTLPTNGYARNYSGVSLGSFMKKITFQEVTEKGIKILGPVIEKMAEAEQLQGHKNAVTIRLESLESQSSPSKRGLGGGNQSFSNYNKKLKMRARELRNNSTLAEGMLWKYVLRAKGIGYPFKRQRPIGNYIVDFVSLPLKLVIEVDGITHSYETVNKKDSIKQRSLEELGFKVVRIADEDILKNVDRVRNYLVEEIKNLPLNPPLEGESNP